MLLRGFHHPQPLLLYCYSTLLLFYSVILLYCYSTLLFYSVILLYCYSTLLLFYSTVIPLYCYSTVIILYCYPTLRFFPPRRPLCHHDLIIHPLMIPFRLSLSVSVCLSVRLPWCSVRRAPVQTHAFRPSVCSSHFRPSVY